MRVGYGDELIEVGDTIRGRILYANVGSGKKRQTTLII